MTSQNTTAALIRLDERNHVEKPFLDQLAELNWEILDLRKEQLPQNSYRNSFTDVVMEPILRESIHRINSWLDADQIDDVVKQLTASFPSNKLLENNQHVFRLLLENTSVSENRQTGEKSPTVRFVDFQELRNNRFIAVCQLKVRILGTEHYIIPDIVLFLNGLPVVLVECKSPKVREPIPEAIDQILRYSEQRGERGEGNQSIFFYNQFVIATCRNEAKFGTITTHNEKHFYRWADPYPRSLDDLAHGSSSPNDQQRLVAGMLDRQNLLNIIRTFTLFSTDDKGRLVKIVGRYQQFRAVKRAVIRLTDGTSPRDRSGIIWHTQGSGKSLTMMFMVREMYHHPQLCKWKVVFVTDRTQLEEQLGDTSQSVGYTVKVAESIEDLKKLLRDKSSDLVMAMIHKFRETELRTVFPELNDSENILVMIDEAHRSQYALLAANLDKALPHSSRIGYTGTPIDKTERVFGDYIDKYTMRQSIEDKVTLEIIYEGRTHNAEVRASSAATGEEYKSSKTHDLPNQEKHFLVAEVPRAEYGLDAAFEDVFSDYNLQERLQILGYGSRQAYLEAAPTIAAKAKDMVAHYLQHVFPNGLKAQIVATSREAAVRYKRAIDDALVSAISDLQRSNPQRLNLNRLSALRSDVIISGRNDDKPHIKIFTDEAQQRRSIKRFKLPFDVEDEFDGQKVSGDVGILIVNNMLLTGFDAPIEQVMYLDRVIVAHGLLQAIARVNRVGEKGKDKGFVIDYVGIGHHLKRAIDNYDEKEQSDVLQSLSSADDELRELDTKYKALLALLAQNGLTDLRDHDAFFDLFYDEDLRFEYMLAFKALTRSLNLLFPSKEALPYLDTYRSLAEINVLASKHLRDQRLSMKGIPEKLRTLTDVWLQSRGIDQKVKPISILDDEFGKQVSKRKRTKTKAAEVEHAIRHHIDVNLDDDPQLQASFAEALQHIFEEFRDNWERIYQELEKLRQRIRDAESEPTYGLHKKKQMPFFRMLKAELFAQEMLNEDHISKLVELTQQVYLVVERELNLTGFWQSIPARNKLKAEIQQVLLSKEFSQLPNLVINRSNIISRTMELAEKNNDRILYAS